jgi:hypothetical protein
MRRAFELLVIVEETNMDLTRPYQREGTISLGVGSGYMQKTIHS